MSPVDLSNDILVMVGEPEGIFHTQDTVTYFVQHAEQFIGMMRAITERTLSLTLTFGTLFYAVPFPDYIYPVRVTLNKKQLQPTTYARVTDNNPNWTTHIGEPRMFFTLGCNILAVYPLAPSTGLTLQVTYIAAPPMAVGGIPLTTDPQWHEALMPYVAGILLAKEHKFAEAYREMQEFFEKAGMKRDPRFAPAETKGKRTEEMLHPPQEPEIES